MSDVASEPILPGVDAELLDEFVLAGRNNGPELLFDRTYYGPAEHRISAEERRGLLLDVWSACEWPAQCLEEDTWLGWFEDAGFLSDDGQPPRLPPHTHRRPRRHAHRAVPARTPTTRCKPFCGDGAAT